MEKALRGLIDNIEDTRVSPWPTDYPQSFSWTEKILKPPKYSPLIHEFAQIWLGSSALSGNTLKHHSYHDEEVWCNQVAAEALVPLADLQREYRSSCEVNELTRLR